MRYRATWKRGLAVELAKPPLGCAAKPTGTLTPETNPAATIVIIVRMSARRDGRWSSVKGRADRGTPT